GPGRRTRTARPRRTRTGPGRRDGTWLPPVTESPEWEGGNSGGRAGVSRGIGDAVRGAGRGREGRPARGRRVVIPAVRVTIAGQGVEGIAERILTVVGQPRDVPDPIRHRVQVVKDLVDGPPGREFGADEVVESRPRLVGQDGGANGFERNHRYP